MHDITFGPESEPVRTRVRRPNGVAEHVEYVVELFEDANGSWVRFAPTEVGPSDLVIDVDGMRALIAAVDDLEALTR